MNHSDPSHENHEERPTSGANGHTGHGLMMLICVALMGGAAAFLLWRGGSLGSSAWLLLPMLLCLGMHLLMHNHLGLHRRDRDE
ncbi:hypothetical protein [Aidingimonas lacisalsi]|uniref:hypothetical protein n=1 Tax=Aidingimonas lacisalsi TaxID=2604086 RepID=UPI0011D28BBD|nr:hypothetical protein [Aidingimonas lacisalsi]